MGILGSGTRFEGAVKPDAISVDAYEADLYAQRYTEIPNNMTKRVDYSTRTDGQPVYVGWGCKGLAESADGWLIYSSTYDASNRITSIKVGYGIWDNRATVVYE
jgi:hypothetical protein